MKRPTDTQDMITPPKRLCGERPIASAIIRTQKRPAGTVIMVPGKRLCRQEMVVRRYLCEYNYTDVPMNMEVRAYYG